MDMIIISTTAIEGAYGKRPFVIEQRWANANAIRPFGKNIAIIMKERVNKTGWVLFLIIIFPICSIIFVLIILLFQV